MNIVNTYKKSFLFLFLWLSATSIWAQKDDEKDKKNGTIDTERLIIVKPYSPSVSDAFKVKQTPVINDSTERKKKPVSYDIFSFPVASTFTPAKGKAAGVERKSRPRLFDNYAAVGAGNYTNIMAELYSTVELDRNQALDFALTNLSSQGGIENAVLDDAFSTTGLDVGYQSQAREFTWGADFGVEHRVFNWYGAPVFLPITDEAYNAIDPQHSFYAVSLGADIDMESGVFDKAGFLYRRFGDNFSSGENRVKLTPEFQFPVAREQWLKTEVMVDFVYGKFDQQLYAPEEITYSYLNLGVAPSYQINSGDLSVDLGLQAVFSLDSENSENDFFVYPKIKGSYRIAGDYFIAYAGAQGALNQNTYYDFSNENPFVSPTLFVAPTDKQYEIYAGGKGKFTESLSYDVRASYTSEKNKALFQHNPYNANATAEPYGYFNSFGIVYDDVTTVGAFGELQFAVNNQLQLKANASFNTFSLDAQAEAWNLPQLQGSLWANYQITEKWSAGAGAYAVGKRKDLYSFANGNSIEETTVEVDPYFDLNLRVGYQLNERLGFFLKGNNLLEGNYQRWLGYSVQSLQVLAGASYQFDW